MATAGESSDERSGSHRREKIGRVRPAPTWKNDSDLRALLQHVLREDAGSGFERGDETRAGRD